MSNNKQSVTGTHSWSSEKRQPNNACVHYYTHSTKIKTPSRRGFTQSSLSKIARVVTKYLGEIEDLKRGDVILVKSISRDESEGMFIYIGCPVLDVTADGQLVDLTTDDGSEIEDRDLENIGATEQRLIPRIFSVPDEFPIRYWANVIMHNCYVPFDYSKWKEQLYTNFARCEYYTLDEFEDTLFYSWFEYQNEKYYVILNDAESDDSEKKDNIDRDTFISILEKRKYLEYIPNIEDEDEEYSTAWCGSLQTDQEHILKFKRKNIRE